MFFQLELHRPTSLLLPAIRLKCRLVQALVTTCVSTRTHTQQSTYVCYTVVQLRLASRASFNLMCSFFLMLWQTRALEVVSFLMYSRFWLQFSLIFVNLSRDVLNGDQGHVQFSLSTSGTASDLETSCKISTTCFFHSLWLLTQLCLTITVMTQLSSHWCHVSLMTSGAWFLLLTISIYILFFPPSTCDFWLFRFSHGSSLKWFGSPILRPSCFPVA